MATLNALVTEKNDEIDALEDELELVRSGSRAVREQLELAEAERNKAFKDNARLDSDLRDWQRKYAVLEKAAMTVAPKSVTRNDYSEALALVIPLVERLCRDLTQDQRNELHQSTLMDRITACPEWPVQQFKELSEAVIGEVVVRAKNKSVTRKRVTKKAE